ncbi:hypothetical protein [Budvicia aquatica]|uniref:Uncharacterized protein n=1 Tax=Budvicia aquatica TaxID=82979 RepID=A0A2C6DKE9_9GAMM|nr:hypothetical protein [Budvicia aquatica]PHI29173.1 hypothetical protein CRN84_07485 [Budvicia aquatica]
MVVKTESVGQAWQALLAEIGRDVDYHRVRVDALNRIDRAGVVILLLSLVLSGVWGGIYGLGLGLLAVFFGVSVGAFIVAHRLSRQVRRHTDVMDRLIFLQSWACGTPMTEGGLLHLSRERQHIDIEGRLSERRSLA